MTHPLLYTSDGQSGCLCTEQDIPLKYWHCARLGSHDYVQEPKITSTLYSLGDGRHRVSEWAIIRYLVGEVTVPISRGRIRVAPPCIDIFRVCREA